MKKLLILIGLVFILSSCDTEKIAMDSWLGSTKQNMYLKMGPPDRVTDDGAGGEILTYSKNVYWPQTGNWTTYKMFYVNSEGKIYHWKTSNRPVPPTEVIIKTR